MITYLSDGFTFGPFAMPTTHFAHEKSPLSITVRNDSSYCLLEGDNTGSIAAGFIHATLIYLELHKVIRVTSYTCTYDFMCYPYGLVKVIEKRFYKRHQFRIMM